MLFSVFWGFFFVEEHISPTVGKGITAFNVSHSPAPRADQRHIHAGTVSVYR